MTHPFVLNGEGWLGRSLVNTHGFREANVSLRDDNFEKSAANLIKETSALIICETLSPTRATSEVYREKYLLNLQYLLEAKSTQIVVFLSSAITTQKLTDLSPNRVAYQIHKRECEALLIRHALAHPEDRILIIRSTAIIGVDCHSNFICETKRRLQAGEEVTLNYPNKRINGFVAKSSLIEFIKKISKSNYLGYGLYEITLAAIDSISIGEISIIIRESGYSNISCVGDSELVEDDLYDVSRAVSLGFEARSCRSLVAAFFGET
jgi:hypothetical protein